MSPDKRLNRTQEVDGSSPFSSTKSQFDHPALAGPMRTAAKLSGRAMPARSIMKPVGIRFGEGHV